MFTLHLCSNSYVALAVFNTLAWPRREVVEVPLEEGLPAMKQYSAFGRTGYALLDNIPALGVKGYTLTEEAKYDPVKVSTDGSNNIVMENVYVRATFDKSGHLIALVDKKLE